MNKDILEIITTKVLTYDQKVLALAKAAENTLSVLNISPGTRELLDKGIICDLEEGAAPYRPRYILPDYEGFFRRGSEFLELPPPENLDEALDSLLILYHHVPSITSFPTFFGKLDSLLEKFTLSDPDPKPKIARLLRHLDKTVTDSFCQINLGPEETLTGRLILETARENPEPTPNISFLYDIDITPDSFAEEAAKTALYSARPGFANHRLYSKENPTGYGIASCYNALPIQGGAYTLVRLKLSTLAVNAKNKDDFFKNALPDAVYQMCSYMDERIRFIAEESNFFESSFLSTENLISKNRFTAMFGVVGLAECVNHLLNIQAPAERFGHTEETQEFGLKIMQNLYDLVKAHENKYCQISGNKFTLHAQVGRSNDSGTTPGCRIPIGEEPLLHRHLIWVSPFHKFFDSGVGDIFAFEPPAKNNPTYLTDLLKGAFKSGMRFLSFYSSDSDVVRISGYLVKRSQMEALSSGKAVIRNTTILGKEAVENLDSLNRRTRTTEELPLETPKKS